MKIQEFKLVKPAISKFLELLPPKPWTVVFDIDDTVLEGEPQKRINPVYEVYKYLLSQPGTRIYCVTAREASPENLEYTKNDLKRHGMGQYQCLYLRPAGEWNFAKFKAGIRTYINRKYGRRVNVNVGNLLTDLFGPGQITRYKTQLDKFKVTRFYVVKTPTIIRLKLPSLWADKRRAKPRRNSRAKK